jgi:hypothetical protein
MKIENPEFAFVFMIVRAETRLDLEFADFGVTGVCCGSRAVKS